MTEDSVAARLRRQQWPVRIYRLGDEPPDDLLSVTTPAERVEMVWELTARTWELAGSPATPYTRETMPGRVIRPE